MSHNGPLLAGAAARPITPDLERGPVYLAGFGRNRVASEVESDLMVRVVALQTGQRPLVLAICDLIGLPRATVLEIRHLAQQRGLDPSRFVVSCTHTHSGPDTMGLWGPDVQTPGRDPNYLDTLRETIVDAAREAVDALQPASLVAARGELAGWIRNARDAEIVDRDLLVLRALNDANEPIFTLLNLACHPEVLWKDSTLISPDYAGAACRAVEREGGVAALAVGAIGGMLTPDTPDHSVASVTAMGSAVAARALQLLAGAERLSVEQIAFRRKTVPLPVETPLLRAAVDAGLVPVAHDDAGRTVTEVGLALLDPVRMATAPGELLPQVGFEVKALLDCPYPFIVGLADDEIGYVLPQDAFVLPDDPFEPGDHYEETMSLGPHTAPGLLAAWQELLAEVE